MSSQGKQIAERFFQEFFFDSQGVMVNKDSRLLELKKYINSQKEVLPNLSGDKLVMLQSEIFFLEKIVFSISAKIRHTESSGIKEEISSLGNEWQKVLQRWCMANESKFHSSSIEKFASQCFGVSINKLSKS